MIAASANAATVDLRIAEPPICTAKAMDLTITKMPRREIGLVHVAT